MQRDASFLRCSKLSCYAEFNKMVQALSIHGKGETFNNLRPPLKGTSAEYNFYQTLNIMLHQVLSTADADGQKKELRMIYQWFTLNKPLAAKRVRPNVKKPQLVFSSKRSALLPSRPQTAPASLGYYADRKTPTCPPPTPALTTFASSFMTRTIKSPQKRTARPSTQPLPQRGNKAESDANQQELIVFPSRTANHSPIPSTANKLYPSTIGLTSGAIYANASSVAAQMTIDRMLSHDQWESGPHGRSYQEREALPQRPSRSHSAQEKISEVAYQASSPPPTTARRSKSMTTLETISETEYEDVVDEQILEMTTNEDSKDETKHISTQSCKELSREIRTIDENPPDQNDLSHSVARNTKTVKPLEPPRVTIKEKNTKQLLNGPDQQNTSSTSTKSSSARSRKVCQVQVLRLDLPPSTTDTRAQNTTRCPKKLVPIVAGFNQQHYRPRTVA